MKLNSEKSKKNKAQFIGELDWRCIADNSRDMLLLSDFSFVDSNGKMWTAPKGSIVNGASIPRVLWIWGSPFVGKYRRASAIHDVYCNTRTEKDEETHNMFIEACCVDGVGSTKSKLMKTALKIGAPKW